MLNSKVMFFQKQSISYPLLIEETGEKIRLF